MLGTKEYEAMLEIEEDIIVLLPKSIDQKEFLEGNFYVNENLVATCSFGTYQLEYDLSNKNKIDKNDLLEKFEEEMSEIYDQLIEILLVEDFFGFVEEIWNSIDNRMVRVHCKTLYKELQDQIDEEVDVEYVAQLLNDLFRESQTDPMELPIRLNEPLYQTTRALFECKNRQYPSPYYRVTIPKPMFRHIKDPSEVNVQIDLVNFQKKLQFKVIPNLTEYTIIKSVTRKATSNSDGSLRFRLPIDPVLKHLKENKNPKRPVYISIDQSFQIITFDICEELD